MQQQQHRDSRFNSVFGISFNPAAGFDPLGQISGAGPNRLQRQQQIQARHEQVQKQQQKQQENQQQHQPRVSTAEVVDSRVAELQQHLEEINSRNITIGPDYTPSETLYPPVQRAPSRQTGAIVTRRYDCGINPFDSRATQREAIRRASPLSVSALTTDLIESEEQRVKRHRAIPVTLAAESEYWHKRLERHKRLKERKRRHEQEQTQQQQRTSSKSGEDDDDNNKNNQLDASYSSSSGLSSPTKRRRHEGKRENQRVIEAAATAAKTARTAEQCRRQRMLAEQEVAIASARLSQRETGVRGMQHAKALPWLNYFSTPYQQAAAADADAKKDAVIHSSSNTAHLGQHDVQAAAALAAARAKLHREKQEQERLEKEERQRQRLLKKQQEQQEKGGGLGSGDDDMPPPSLMISSGDGTTSAKRNKSNNDDDHDDDDDENNDEQMLMMSMTSGWGSVGSGAGGKHQQPQQQQQQPGMSMMSWADTTAHYDGPSSLDGTATVQQLGRALSGLSSNGSNDPLSRTGSLNLHQQQQQRHHHGKPSLLMGNASPSANNVDTSDAVLPLHRGASEKKLKRQSEERKVSDFYRHLLPADVQFRARATHAQILREQRQQVLKKHRRKVTDGTGLEPQSKMDVLISRIMHFHNVTAAANNHQHQQQQHGLVSAISGTVSGGLLQLNLQAQSRYAAHQSNQQTQRNYYGLTLGDVRAMRDEFNDKTDLKYVQLVQAKTPGTNSLGDRLVDAKMVKSALARSESGLDLTFENLFRCVYGTGARCLPVSAINALLGELHEEDELRAKSQPYSFRRFVTVKTAKDIDESFNAILDFCRQQAEQQQQTTSQQVRPRRVRVSEHGDVGITQDEYCAYMRRQSSVMVSAEQAGMLFRQVAVPQKYDKQQRSKQQQQHQGANSSSNSRLSTLQRRASGANNNSSNNSGSAVGFGNRRGTFSGSANNNSGAITATDDTASITSSDAESVPSSEDEDEIARKKRDAEREKQGLPPIKRRAHGSSPGARWNDEDDDNNNNRRRHSDSDSSSYDSWTSSCSSCTDSWSSGGSASSRASSSSSSRSSSSADSEVLSNMQSGVFVPSSRKSKKRKDANSSSETATPQSGQYSANVRSLTPQHSQGTIAKPHLPPHHHKHHKSTLPHYALPTESTATPSLPPPAPLPDEQHRPRHKRGGTSTAATSSTTATDGAEELTGALNALVQKSNSNSSNSNTRTGKARRPSRGKSIRYNSKSSIKRGASDSCSSAHRHHRRHRHHHHHSHHHPKRNKDKRHHDKHKKKIRRKYIITVEEWALLILPSLKAKIDELKRLHQAQREKESVFLNAAAQSGLTVSPSGFLPPATSRMTPQHSHSHHHHQHGHHQGAPPRHSPIQQPQQVQQRHSPVAGTATTPGKTAHHAHLIPSPPSVPPPAAAAVASSSLLSPTSRSIGRSVSFKEVEA